MWTAFKGLFINSRVGVGHRGYWTVVKEWVVNGRRRTCRVVESIWQTETKALFKKENIPYPTIRIIFIFLKISLETIFISVVFLFLFF